MGGWRKGRVAKMEGDEIRVGKFRGGETGSTVKLLSVFTLLFVVGQGRASMIPLGL